MPQVKMKREEDRVVWGEEQGAVALLTFPVPQPYAALPLILLQLLSYLSGHIGPLKASHRVQNADSLLSSPYLVIRVSRLTVCEMSWTSVIENANYHI